MAPPAQGGYQQGNKKPWGGTPKSTENFEARQKYWENKEIRDIEVVEPRITIAASRTAAIQVIDIALRHDALAFGNASKGAKLGMILDFVDEVTARFYAQSMNAASAVAEMGGGGEPTGAAEAGGGSDDE